MAALSKIRVARDGRGFVNTEGRRFVPFGVTYYRPNTGWAPQLWKQFDAAATRRDFAQMKDLGVNCVRVFLSYGSFYRRPGELDAEGVAKFDQFLSIAEAAGIYVQPTGPDAWEGPPEWPVGGIGDPVTLANLESYWKLFAARYAGRNVILDLELRNEPAVEWNGLEKQWAAWLKAKYGDAAPPATVPVNNDSHWLDYQLFRESLADDWTRRQVAAIKSADPTALVTVGMVQWSVPSLLPSLRDYAAFNPMRQARYLDFLTIHFYPLEDGGFKYQSSASLARNLSYLEGIVRVVSSCGKPAVLGEFGWYGGGVPTFDNGHFPPATQQQQAGYDRQVVEISSPFVCGWLNWGLYDDLQATDCSQLIGLLTEAGEVKAWGRSFAGFSVKYNNRAPAPPAGPWPELNWAACLTNAAAQGAYRQSCYQIFTNNWRVVSPGF